MLDFFAHSSVLPYTVALGIMGGLFVLEMFAALIGFHPIDSFLPDFDMDFGEAGAEGAGLEMHGLGIGAILGWFHFGRVPALLILSLFLAGFGTAGLMVQLFAMRSLGFYMPYLITLPIALISAIFTTRYGGMILAQIMPRDESNAVSRSQFVGQVATVVHGTADHNRKAEARLIDAHGISHYFLVEPALDQSAIQQGEEVLIVSAEEAHYIVVRADMSHVDLNKKNVAH